MESRTKECKLKLDKRLETEAKSEPEYKWKRFGYLEVSNASLLTARVQVHSEEAGVTESSIKEFGEVHLP